MATDASKGTFGSERAGWLNGRGQRAGWGRRRAGPTGGLPAFSSPALRDAIKAALIQKSRAGGGPGFRFRGQNEKLRSAVKLPSSEETWEEARKAGKNSWPH